MQEVNLYIEVSIRGPQKRDCKYGYVIETITEKGPATLSNVKPLEQVTEHQAYLKATIKALERIKKPCHLVLFIDSEYIVVSIMQGWVEEWSTRNWINAKGKPVANQEEWKEMWNLLNRHTYEFKPNQPHTYKAWLNREVKEE